MSCINGVVVHHVNRWLWTVGACAVLCQSGAAWSQEQTGDQQGSPGGDQQVEGGDGAGGQAMMLGTGHIAVVGSLQIGLSAESAGGGAFKPVSIAPDGWYGVNDKLDAGIVTSATGTSGFWSGQAVRLGTGIGGSGLCVTGQDRNCPKVFDNVGVAAHYLLSSDASLSVAADGGLFAGSFDPFALSLKVGMVGMWHSRRIAVEFSPSLFLGITQRDIDMTTGRGGNREVVNLPLAVMYMVLPDLALGLQSGLTGIVDPPGSLGFGDTYSVPVALGAMYYVSPQLMIGGAFSFDRVAGGAPPGTSGPSASKLRSLDLLVGYRM